MDRITTPFGDFSRGVAPYALDPANALIINFSTRRLKRQSRG
jgi:hypothetical protein